MKTVSILQYDHDEHQFHPSFVIHDDHQDNDTECAFDELVIQPSDEWMDDYLEWNRFGRLPDDPAEDHLDEEDDAAFSSLQDLHDFNAQGHELTARLKAELAPNSKCIRVAPFRPLFTNIQVGPVASWWHVKDLNYDFIVPVQRLPVSDELKERLQAFRCHKGMEFWQNLGKETMQGLQQERKDLQKDMKKELCGWDDASTTSTGSSSSTGSEGGMTDEDNGLICNRVESLASLGTLMEQSCSVAASSSQVERAALLRAPQRVI